MSLHKDNNSSSSSGIGLCGLTFLVFLVLKLVGVIDWSWWWVCAPLWAMPAVLILITIVLLIISGIMDIVEKNYIKK